MRRPHATAFGLALLPVLAAIGPAAAAAQDARAAIIADTIRVGDVVTVAVRVVVRPGERVAWPDTLPLGESPDIENAARVRERVDTLDDGRIQVTGIYSVTPWRPGEAPLPELAVGVVSGDEAVTTLTASLPALDVTSVLPADTAGIEPRPLRGVIGRSWAWLPILLILLGLLALLGALYWWLRRRRAAVTDAGAAAIPPRERALERLRQARAAGMVERGEWKPFYSAIAAALRHYIAEQNPAWGEDLTTTELLARIRRDAGADPAREVGGVLRSADQVKFARRDSDPTSALGDWEAARSWIEGWPPPPVAPADDAVGEAA